MLSSPTWACTALGLYQCVRGIYHEQTASVALHHMLTIVICALLLEFLSRLKCELAAWMLISPVLFMWICSQTFATIDTMTRTGDQESKRRRKKLNKGALS